MIACSERHIGSCRRRLRPGVSTYRCRGSPRATSPSSSTVRSGGRWLDDQWRSLYKTTQIATKGTATDNIFRQCRFYSTLQMAGYAAGLSSGDVIECGCWHGHSTVAIATILARTSFPAVSTYSTPSREGCRISGKGRVVFQALRAGKTRAGRAVRLQSRVCALANGAVWLRRATPRLDTPVVRLFCRGRVKIRTHRCGYVRAHARRFGIVLEGTRTRRLYGRG